jgi:hypothetical protein
MHNLRTIYDYCKNYVDVRKDGESAEDSASTADAEGNSGPAESDPSGTSPPSTRDDSAPHDSAGSGSVAASSSPYISNPDESQQKDPQSTQNSEILQSTGSIEDESASKTAGASTAAPISSLAEAIEHRYRLSKELSARWERMFFLCYHRFETSKRRLDFVTYADFDQMARLMMQYWFTSSSFYCNVEQEVSIICNLIVFM